VRESLKKAYSDTLKETKAFTEEQKIAIVNNAAESYCFERTNEIINRLYEHIANHYEIYITSLCESHSKAIKSNILHGLFRQSNIYDGLLSQWRAYGGDGGYAIEFQKNNITERVNEERNRFANYAIILGDVIYNDDENEYKQHFSEQLDIIKTDTKDDKPREFRNKNGEQVPYIELFKNKKDLSENTRLLINKIIVGPHKDKEARAAWLRIKLDSMGRDDIEVAVSQIPFVGR
jgi:hypothetical protein